MGTRGQAFAASPHGGRTPALRSCAVAPELFRAEAEANRHTIAYARVSRHDKKDVLEIITGSALGYTGVSSTP
ncbi:hypothetical protein A7K72_02870 [Candidatus Methylacidiphilum fumarolicum]|nr:hypothetical protein A7K72_02870 [Candidatus Methylacidiphilum fumarolicum]